MDFYKNLAMFGCFLATLLYQTVSANETNREQYLNQILNQVLIHDSVLSLQRLQRLETGLMKLKRQPDATELKALQGYFIDFIRSWKAVETTYIAGALDDEYLDHPRFIDYFHQGNESVKQRVLSAVKSEEPLPKALFKHSTKSINALEILLFSPAKKQSESAALTLAEFIARDQRRLKAALLAIKNVKNWLGEIVDFYSGFTGFGETKNQALEHLINALIDSSYKLKVWRVAEAGGLIKKYKGNTNALRLEYHASSASLDAIIAILKTHRRIIQPENSPGLFALGKSINADADIRFIVKKLDQALATATSLPRPLALQLDTNLYRDFYRQLKHLHDAYFLLLIDALGLNARIIDADGD